MTNRAQRIMRDIEASLDSGGEAPEEVRCAPAGGKAYRLPTWFPRAEAEALRSCFDRLGALRHSSMGPLLEQASFWASQQAQCPRCRGDGRVWSSKKTRKEAEERNKALRTAEVRHWAERLGPAEALEVYQFWRDAEPDQGCPRCKGSGRVVRPIRRAQTGGIPIRPSGGSMQGASSEGVDPTVVAGLGEILRRLRAVERRTTATLTTKDSETDVTAFIHPGWLRGRRPGVVLAATIEAWFSSAGGCLEALWPATVYGRLAIAGLDLDTRDQRARAKSRKGGPKAVAAADQQARRLLEAALQAWLSEGT